MRGMHRGSCLCGAVRFAIDGSLPPPDACHCTECRKSSGHYFVSTDVPRDRLTIEGLENVRWYRSSEKVQRGFCATCGSTLFWDPIGKPWTAVAMGGFEAPTGTKTKIHVYVAEKGDYYDLTDGLPQADTVPNPRA